jgi:hypothetical protein
MTYDGIGTVNSTLVGFECIRHNTLLLVPSLANSLYVPSAILRLMSSTEP